jgi:acyl-CoA thioester hydrolase
MSQTAAPYELAVAVRPDDIDENEHVNNVTYLRWVQEAAIAHWRAAAPAEDQGRLFWVVLRHEIDYKQAAYLDDALVARTWVGEASRLRFDRHTEILRARDRAVLAVARTVWCPIDVSTGRPAAVSAEVRAIFSTNAA